MYPDVGITVRAQSCYSKIIPGILEDWRSYPQCLFPDWTPDRVQRSGVLLNYDHAELCTVHEVYLLDDGENKQYTISHANGNEALTAACWNWLQAPVSAVYSV